MKRESKNVRIPYIKLDVSFYILTVLAITLGYIDQYVIFAVTILIHETGHLLMGVLFGWEVEELTFFALGGKLKFKGELNKSNKEDILISIAGVLFNFIFLMILLVFKDDSMPTFYLKKYQFLIFAQVFIIVFNLIPLPPLDGGRILSAVLCHFFPYIKVLKLTTITNYIFLMCLPILVAIFSYDFQKYFMMYTFLIYSTLKHNQKQKYLFQRFLLQKKYHRNTNLQPRTVKVNQGTWEDHIYRGYLNLFQFKSHFNDEIKCLNLKYGEKRP